MLINNDDKRNRMLSPADIFNHKIENLKDKLSKPHTLNYYKIRYGSTVSFVLRASSRNCNSDIDEIEIDKIDIIKLFRYST